MWDVENTLVCIKFVKEIVPIVVARLRAAQGAELGGMAAVLKPPTDGLLEAGHANASFKIKNVAAVLSGVCQFACLWWSWSW